MKFNKKLAVAVSGAVLLMAGQIALADSTTDIVDALVSKGILTEEEGKLISKGAKSQKEAQDKAIKSAGKIKISDAIESATLYGDLRVRLEDRQATGEVGAAKSGHGQLDRFRGKFVLGMTATSGDFYSDFALSTGSKGRSDNFTFGQSATVSSGLYSAKNSGDQAIGVNKLMVGWKATDWLSLEVGRMKNPLYTTQMVWDADLPVEGLTEKFNYKFGDVNVFANLSQIQYLGVASAANLYFNNGSAATTSKTVQLFANQLGAEYDFNDKTSAKAAVTYYSYNHSDDSKHGGSSNFGIFDPGLVNAAYNASTGMGINNLSIVEIPAEINYMAFNNVGVRLYGDYAVNTTADQRANAACIKGTTTQACNTSGDDYAFLAGIVIGSAPDLKTFKSNKMKQGDWQARLWYQEIGMWALDPNTVDSDYMDGRVNTKGVVAKGQYNLRDNVLFNLSAGYGQRLNDKYSVGGYGDMGFNWSHMSVVQTDLVWKF